MAGTWVHATGQSHLLSRPGMYATVATAIHYHLTCVQWGDSNALPPPESLCTPTDWSFLLLEKCETSTVHARVFACMCFLTVTTSLAASRISQTPLSQQLFFFPKPTPHWLDTHSRLFLSRSYGISREPPRPGCEGRLERQKAAQGCGGLHVEHHHSEGEIFSHITYKSSQFY